VFAEIKDEKLKMDDNYRIYSRYEIDGNKLVKDSIKQQLLDQTNRSANESTERGKIEDIKNRPFLYGLRL